MTALKHAALRKSEIEVRSLEQFGMENVDLKPLVRDLQGNIDDLEEALAPLLKAALPESAAKLPLLDKAKLHVHITYAIESILFCESALD